MGTQTATNRQRRDRETVMEKKVVAGYEITVNGTFFASQDRNKVLRTFGNETFFLPEFSTIRTGYMWKETKQGGHTIKRSVPKMERVNSLQWASHIVQRYFLPARLAAKYKDFVRFRTCVIVNTKRVAKEMDAASDLREENIATMTLEQLRALCALRAVALPLDSFADINEARTAVRDELSNLKLAERKQSTAPEPELTPEAPEVETIGAEGSIVTSPVNDDDLFS